MLSNNHQQRKRISGGGNSSRITNNNSENSPGFLRILQASKANKVRKIHIENSQIHQIVNNTGYNKQQHFFSKSGNHYNQSSVANCSIDDILEFSSNNENSMELNLTQLETYSKVESQNVDTKARFNFGLQGNQFNQKTGYGISARGGISDASTRLQTSEGSTYGRSTLKGYLTSATAQANKVNSAQTRYVPP